MFVIGKGIGSVLCWAILAAGLSANAQTKSASSVVSSVVNAYGGAATLKEHRQLALHSQGTISSNSGISGAANTYECQVLEKGDKVKVEMKMLGVPMILGYDGTNSWTQYGDWVAPGTPTSTEIVCDELKHGLPVLAEVLNPESHVEVLNKESVHGKMCDVFRLTTKDGKDTKFYADPTSHLIVRADYDGTDHELGIKAAQVIEYSDYRPVVDSLEPFRVVQFSGPRKKTETLITSINVDPRIDDSTFQMPPESEFAGLAKDPIVLPFEYTGNEIVVKVRINNGSEARFIVDTGASQSVIDKEAAADIGPHPVSTFSITTGSRAVPLSYTTVSSIGLGNITLHDVPVLITDLSNVGGHPVGLIGANILKRFLVTIDYDERKLILGDPRVVSVKPTDITVPTSPVFGGTALIVKGTLDDKTSMNFLVDTGASFNNMPQALAKPLYGQDLLPVGVIYGLDGQKVSIGSIKLKTLKIGGATVPDPVFTLSPDATPNASGLFNTKSMGILGNPLWSQFKTTIDYRNERLILERQPDRNTFNQLVSSLESIDEGLLRTKDQDKALKGYNQVLSQAQAAQQKAAEALATARIAGCYTEKYLASKDTSYLDLASRQFEKASRLANESRNRSIDGQILAQWALMYLNAPRSNDDINASRNLLSKAFKKAPMEPHIFAAFGAILMRSGKTAEAEKLLDRALVLDPSNWQALWSKYHLYQKENRPRELALVAAQLHHYYPTLPDVMALHVPQPATTTATAPRKTSGKK